LEFKGYLRRVMGTVVPLWLRLVTVVEMLLLLLWQRSKYASIKEHFFRLLWHGL
jgi:hypothetical protein